MTSRRNAAVVAVIQTQRKPAQVDWPFDCRIAGDDMADLQLLDVAERHVALHPAAALGNPRMARMMVRTRRAMASVR